MLSRWVIVLDHLMLMCICLCTSELKRIQQTDLENLEKTLKETETSLSVRDVCLRCTFEIRDILHTVRINGSCEMRTETSSVCTKCRHSGWLELRIFFAVLTRNIFYALGFKEKFKIIPPEECWWFITENYFFLVCVLPYSLPFNIMFEAHKDMIGMNTSKQNHNVLHHVACL